MCLFNSFICPSDAELYSITTRSRTADCQDVALCSVTATYFT